MREHVERAGIERERRRKRELTKVEVKFKVDFDIKSGKEGCKGE